MAQLIEIFVRIKTLSRASPTWNDQTGPLPDPQGLRATVNNAGSSAYCGIIFRAHTTYVSLGKSHHVAPHCMNPYDGLGIDEQLELEEEAEAIESRLAPVLIDGDERVEGLAAIARRLGMSSQRLAYGLSKLYPELKFIWQDVGPKPESMASSLQNVRGVIVETIGARVRQKQQDRGRARGQANKRPQMWHGSLLASPQVTNRRCADPRHAP